jgi:hypothetical protein
MSDAEDEFAASAEGIMQCLRLLAQEAASLKLAGSLSAIENALAVVMMEGRQTQATLAPAGAALRLH